MEGAFPAIREERAGDAVAIATVHRAAFPTEAEGRLVDALRRAGRLTVSLVALVGDEIVGHVAFSPVTVTAGGGGLGLAPVAVAPALQKRGIGTALVAAGLAECRRQATGFVVVLGEPDYYRRFGFVEAARYRLADEYGGGAAFQVIELAPGSIPAGGGLVRYAAEFALFADGAAP